MIKTELGNVGLNSEHGKHVMFNQLFETQLIFPKLSKVGFLEAKLNVGEAKVEMANVMILEDILIGGCAEIVHSRGNLFVETKNQHSLRKVNVLKNCLVSGRGVGNVIDQLQTGDTGKLYLFPSDPKAKVSRLDPSKSWSRDRRATETTEKSQN